MKKKAMLLSLLLAALVVCGCALRRPSAEAMNNPANFEPYPENYRFIVNKWIHQNFYDPYSFEDLYVSAPKKGWLNKFGWIYYGWTGLIRYNAKNRFGVYIGMRYIQYFIPAGGHEVSMTRKLSYKEIRKLRPKSAIGPFH